jgi:hypothetical protein
MMDSEGVTIGTVVRKAGKAALLTPIASSVITSVATGQIAVSPAPFIDAGAGFVAGATLAVDPANDYPHSVMAVEAVSTMAPAIMVGAAAVMSPDVLNIGGQQINTADMPFAMATAALIADRLIARFQGSSRLVDDVLAPIVKGAISGEMLRVFAGDIPEAKWATVVSSVGYLIVDILAKRLNLNAQQIQDYYLTPAAVGASAGLIVEQNIPTIPKGIAPVIGAVGSVVAQIGARRLVEPAYQERLKEQISWVDDIEQKVVRLEAYARRVVDSNETPSVLENLGMAYLSDLKDFREAKVANRERYSGEPGLLGEKHALVDNKKSLELMLSEVEKDAKGRKTLKRPSNALEDWAEYYGLDVDDMRVRVRDMGRQICLNRIKRQYLVESGLGQGALKELFGNLTSEMLAHAVNAGLEERIPDHWIKT